MSLNKLINCFFPIRDGPLLLEWGGGRLDNIEKNPERKWFGGKKDRTKLVAKKEIENVLGEKKKKNGWQKERKCCSRIKKNRSENKIV